MRFQNPENEGKTVIGVLASHDSVVKNNELARLFERLHKQEKKRLGAFHFVFTGGTFKRLVLESCIEIKNPLGKREKSEEKEKKENNKEEEIIPIEDNVAEFIKHRSTCLPSRKIGGVTLLANLVVQRQCSILWTFFSPITVHWLHPENLALMRLCDIWNAKRLMNAASVEAWFQYEAERDIARNPQKIPLEMIFGPEKLIEEKEKKRKGKESKGYFEILLPEGEDREHSGEWWDNFEEQTIALIAHDEMKDRIVDFAIQYENELIKFERILATGATAQAVLNACRRIEDKGNVKPCLPGPKGGDIEIATAVLFNKCHTVIFFIDPLEPHPHVEDIRAVFSACTAEIKSNEVRMLTNEVQAREWIEEAVRRRRTFKQRVSQARKTFKRAKRKR